MKIKKKLSNSSKTLLILGGSFLLTACDFTPKIHKEILAAQEKIKLQKYDESIRLYERILKGNLTPTIKTKVYFQLGELYSLHSGNYEKALKNFKKVKTITEDPAWLVRSEEKIAEIYFTFLNNYEKSAQSYKVLSSFQPRLPDNELYEYRYALSLFEGDKEERAIRAFREIVEEKNHKYFVKSLYYIGLANFHDKNWKEAILVWNRYLRHEQRRDNVVQVKFLMANAYETMEKLKKAYNLYYSILGQYPNTEVVRNRLDSIYHRRVARKR